MKIGIRIPSLNKRIAARTSWKRVVRNNLGLKAPRGWGWLTNPRKAAYNRIYNRTTIDLFQLGRSRKSGCLVMLALAGLTTVGLTLAVAQRNYGGPGAPVEYVDQTWHDGARDRDVPVRMYYPGAVTQALPVIIFSHGLGGSREGYGYLGRHWASHNYIVVHPTHLGSDSGVLKSLRPFRSMKMVAADPINAINRPKDVSLCIDRLTELNRTDKTFKGRIRLDRIGVAGHSFGGFTALASAGQTFVNTNGQSQLADPRISAAIAMSAPAKPNTAAVLDQTYGSIKIPCFVMTGTLDDSPIGETKAADRRIPYDHMPEGHKYLLILTGGDHMVFSGRERLMGGESDERFHDLILQATTAFWDAYLKDDRDTWGWLYEGGFKEALGRDGTFEKGRLNEM